VFIQVHCTLHDSRNTVKLVQIVKNESIKAGAYR
jgi:hypothetical protein